MIDTKKIVEAAKMPAIILVVLSLISIGIAFTMDLVVMSGLSMLIGLIGWAVLLWAGYNAVKKMKFGLVDAGMVGLVASVISGIIGGILNILTMPIIIAKYGGLMAGQVMAGLEVFALIIGVIIGAVFGFVLALIGGLIGQKI
jgi:hypothetical protein